jgi:hypothetical protein
MNEPRNKSQEVRTALCPLQQQQAGEVPVCMATWQETRVCTSVACPVYRKLAELLDIREELRRLVGQLEQELTAEREQLRVTQETVRGLTEKPKRGPQKTEEEANPNG